MGTFNANGKMPSQDLSTWVQGQIFAAPTSALAKAVGGEEKDETFLPPLRRLSSLSLGLGLGNRDAGKEENNGVFIILFVSFLSFLTLFRIDPRRNSIITNNRIRHDHVNFSTLDHNQHNNGP